MQLAGSFNIEKVIANWFVEVEDYKMFQRAFDFAYAISEAQKTYFSSSSIFVTCFAMSYNISRGMYLPVGVSLMVIMQVSFLAQVGILVSICFT